MVWMPVSEAAASLGVSERTVWRRIKSQSIETKSEGGRTLVGLDPPSRGDPMHDLSNVAAAQLSMRKLEADNLCDVLSVLADYRDAFDEQIRRSRPTVRWTIATIVVLVLTLGGIGWFHVNRMARLERSQAAAVARIEKELGQQVNAKTTEAARAESLARARTDEAAHLRSIEQDLRTQLAALESSRNKLQDDASEHFAALEKTLTEQSATIKDRDKQLADLQARVDQLTDSIHHTDRARAAIRRQNDRVMDAFRYDAARSRGLAEGLRIRMAQQQSVIDMLRRELGLSSLPEGPTDTAHADRRTREELWNSMIGAGHGRQDADAVSSTSWRWPAMISTWFSAWIAGGQHTDDLADASTSR